MTEKNAYVRLPKDKQADVLTLAREQGVTVPQVLAEAIAAYAAEPPTVRKKPAIPQDARSLTKVPVDAKVYRKAAARAQAEGKSLSDAIEQAIAARVAGA